MFNREVEQISLSNDGINVNENKKDINGINSKLLDRLQKNDLNKMFARDNEQNHFYDDRENINDKYLKENIKLSDSLKNHE